MSRATFRSRKWIVAVSLLLASVSGFALAGPPDEATGMLAGTVSRGPLTPVERPGDGGSWAPVRGARIVVSSLAGQEAESVATDDRGGYVAHLSPGTYRVTMVPPPGQGFTKDLPATVTIVAGRETRLDIRLDTGMR